MDEGPSPAKEPPCWCWKTVRAVQRGPSLRPHWPVRLTFGSQLCSGRPLLAHTLAEMLSSLTLTSQPTLVAAGDGDATLLPEAEDEAIRRSGIEPATVLHPKVQLGNTFAAAAAVQVGLAAGSGFSRRRPAGSGPLPRLWRRAGLLRPGGGMTRVVVTGMGIVSPVGIGREAFWSSLTAGRSGIGPITLFDASSFPVQFGGEVRGFRPRADRRALPRGKRQSRSKASVGPGGRRTSDRRCVPAPERALRMDSCVWRWVGRRAFVWRIFTAHAKADNLGRALAKPCCTRSLIVPGFRRRWTGPL